jgi:AraC-like DNA-binding protein
MNQRFTVGVRYYRLSEPLRPYFTALYAFDIACADGEHVEDYLHPEWTAMRFTIGPVPQACVGPGELTPQWPFVASGPTSKALHFRLTTGTIWGLGLQPAGWARFAVGHARELTDRTVDGTAHPALARFRPIESIVRDASLDADATAEAINDHLMQALGRPLPQEPLVFACQEAIRDPDIANVAELGERLALNARALERLCSRYFGFPPKILLRRQRFLRSLASFMLDGERVWSSALDRQYYDQAQFVKDFRSFMGMTPSEYAAMPHPIIDRIMAQRMADQGAAPETDLPTILRYGPATGQAD